MTSKEIVAALAQESGISQRRAKKMLKALVTIIRSEVQAQGRQLIADLGVFTLRERAAREVTNSIGKYRLPAGKAVHFKSAAGWKRAVNKK